MLIDNELKLWYEEIQFKLVGKEVSDEYVRIKLMATPGEGDPDCVEDMLDDFDIQGYHAKTGRAISLEIVLSPRMATLRTENPSD